MKGCLIITTPHKCTSLSLYPWVHTCVLFFAVLRRRAGNAQRDDTAGINTAFATMLYVALQSTNMRAMVGFKNDTRVRVVAHWYI
jgi:hypothetical protein